MYQKIENSFNPGIINPGCKFGVKLFELVKNMTLILWQASGVSEIDDSQVDSGGLPLSLKSSGPNIYCKHHDHHVLL